MGRIDEKLEFIARIRLIGFRLTTMRFLASHHITCVRMGVFKPRTNARSFQGHGTACLPYVFEYAAQYIWLIFLTCRLS